ncbi:MAG: hypothetical protein KJZ74_09030 [Gemmatimonadales bacterium]|nr:hypothetical protein [Gemmatimonadota bacterium]MCL4214045.1 hypothetical protein [Gemmatimonadales bacterium]
MQRRTWLLTFTALAAALTVYGSLGATSSSATARRIYGEAQRLGRGTVRAYITLNPSDARKPLEVGIAFSVDAMDGLPGPRATAAPHGAHGAPTANAPTHEVLDSHTLLFDLPSPNPTPFRFVQLDWNPGGHEPPGVYDEPHFDFHFWTASRDVRASIVPSNPEFDQKAAQLPPEEFRMPFYVDAATAAKAPAGAVSVPLMGLHWLDVRSPELQGLTGHPEKQEKFTKTFIYGSWGGSFVFAEPMITRDYILAKRTADPTQQDEVVPVSTPARAQVSGQHPTAYRITWDAQAKEYRVALTGFEPR